MKQKNNCKNIERIIARQVNKERIRHKLSEFKVSYGLIYISRSHSWKMAKAGKIWHGKNTHIAGQHASNKLEKFIKFILYPVAIFFPPLWIIFFFGEKGCSGENVSMMPKGNVKGYKRPIKTDKDIGNALHNNWMNSPGHRANILNGDFTKIGIGVKEKRNKYYATEVFFG